MGFAGAAIDAAAVVRRRVAREGAAVYGHLADVVVVDATTGLGRVAGDGAIAHVQNGICQVRDAAAFCKGTVTGDGAAGHCQLPITNGNTTTIAVFGFVVRDGAVRDGHISRSNNTTATCVSFIVGDGAVAYGQRTCFCCCRCRPRCQQSGYRK